MTGPRFAAVDVGASGGRVMVGTVGGGGTVALEEVHRFPNGVVEREGHLRWDLVMLLNEIERGLSLVGNVTSIGVDTWGVDYVLVDGYGIPVADPISYRDDRTTKVIEEVHAEVSPQELYRISGVQFLPFNTVYQLVAEQRTTSWTEADAALLLPDFVSSHLTGGGGATELTNASTTGLLDVRAGTWSTTLLDRLGIPAHFLPPVEPPGEFRGATADGTPVVSVGSHDTASAVVAVPATTDRFAYIASGTWSLVGLELTAPVLTEEARLANFTNERGVDGRIRFLRNVGGLWLLQECARTWGRSDLEMLLAGAAALPAGGPLIDVDDPTFIPPGDMPGRIEAAAGGGSRTEAQIVRCILDSLAAGYARTVAQAAELSGRTVEVVHVVGGGSQNALLCQLTADAVGLPVLAGPVEATALGNVVVQARAAGALPDSLEEVRAGIAASAGLQRYEPR